MVSCFSCDAGSCNQIGLTLALSLVCVFFFPSPPPLLIFSPFPHRHVLCCIWPMPLGIYGDGLVTKSCPTLVIPWTIALQAPLSVGFLAKNTGVGCHFLLQGIFPTQGPNKCLLCCRWSPALQADALLLSR